MQSTTIPLTFLALMLASALPLAACDNDTSTSPTQPGPSVATNNGPIVSLSGFVAILDRSGPKDLDISFRIDDFTIVRAAMGTPVTYGGQTFNTDAVRDLASRSRRRAAAPMASSTRRGLRSSHRRRNHNANARAPSPGAPLRQPDSP